MFTYLSVYVLAAILLFQGINLLGELEAPGVGARKCGPPPRRAPGGADTWWPAASS